MTIYPKLITDALATVTYPGTKKNLVESEMVADDIRINGNKVSFTLIFPRDTDPFIKSTIKAAEATLKSPSLPNLPALSVLSPISCCLR